MTPETFLLLDRIADAFNPLLAIVALAAPVFRKPRAWRSTILYLVSAGTAIGIVYLIRALDSRHQIWASAGLDFSTHSAFTASLVVSLAAFHRRWLIPLIVSMTSYFGLQLLMRYHGVLDILTSAFLAATSALLLHLAVMRAIPAGLDRQ